MGSNELIGFTKTREVFTYSEARYYTKYRNSQPTITQLCWRGVKTGGTVAIIGV